MVGPASFALIPGVFLIDKDFILRSENVGDQGAGADLYADLLPMAGKLAGKAP
jgi:hypothetical protein